MSEWAPYADALKLILNGSTTRPLDPDQGALFSRMLALGRRGEGGADQDQRELPGVRTQDRDGERFFFIPDLLRFLLREFRDEWDIQAPPLNLDYLNAIQAGEQSHFLFGAAPSAKAWSHTVSGQQHWELICQEIEITRDLAGLQGMDHKGDPQKWRTIRDGTRELQDQLVAVRSQIRQIEETLNAEAVGRQGDATPTLAQGEEGQRGAVSPEPIQSRKRRGGRPKGEKSLRHLLATGQLQSDAIAAAKRVHARKPDDVTRERVALELLRNTYTRDKGFALKSTTVATKLRQSWWRKELG